MFKFINCSKNFRPWKKIYKNLRNRTFSSLLKEKKFIDTVSDLTIFIDKKTNEGKLEKIFLKDKYDDENSKIIIAKQGQILSKNNNYYLSLEDGRMLNLEKKNTNIIEFSESELNLSLYSTKLQLFQNSRN